jgi:phosphohistidine phosphatase
MKSVFLVRHAKSSWDNPHLADFDRPLNSRGRANAPLMAHLLMSKGVAPQAIVTSTARRAVDTAAFFTKAFGITPADCMMLDTLYHASPGQIFDTIHALPESWATVLLFGHNPGLSEFVNLFPGGQLLSLPTCGIAKLFSTAGHWPDFSVANTYMTNFYFPKQMISKEA